MVKIAIVDLHQNNLLTQLHLNQQKQISGGINYIYSDEGIAGIAAYLPGYLSGQYNLTIGEGQNVGPYILISDPQAESASSASIAFGSNGSPLPLDRSNW